jgi:hypothetical protein
MLRSGHLNDDYAYVRTMAKQSEFPFRYHTRFGPWAPCPISNCNKQFHAGPREVDTLNVLADSVSTRVVMQGMRPQTELFGTAPFRARGDGQLLAPDASNAVMRSPVTEHRCGRPISELETNRFEYMGMPNQAEWWQRGGVSCRQGPIYVQPMGFPQ